MTLTDKRICVTGGDGFLGRHLIRALECSGCGDIRVPRWDLTKQDQAFKYFTSVRPDVIFHLAALCGGIGANRARPADFFYANMSMGLNVIDTAWWCGTQKIVVVGTTCSYPKVTPVPFSEDSLWDGYPEETNAPYGVAKRALLAMCQAYRKQHGLNAIYLIPANLYGPGDNFNEKTSHVIPALIRKFVGARERGEQAVTLWGDGSPTREFLYVEDCAAGLIAAAERYDGPAPVNLAGPESLSILKLSEMIAHLTGFDGYIKFDCASPNGQMRRCLDGSRALKEFGWQANTRLIDGLRSTINWYRNKQKAAA